MSVFCRRFAHPSLDTSLGCTSMTHTSWATRLVALRQYKSVAVQNCGLVLQGTVQKHKETRYWGFRIIDVYRIPIWSIRPFYANPKFEILFVILCETRKNLNITEKTSQKWRYIETVFADSIILWISITLHYLHYWMYPIKRQYEILYTYNKFPDFLEIW